MLPQLALWLCCCSENYSTCAEIHGESSKVYRMKLSPLEQKTLMNIQLGVICAVINFSLYV